MKLIKFVCFTSRVIFMARGRQSERISDIERDDERQLECVHADSVRMRDGIRII